MFSLKYIQDKLNKGKKSTKSNKKSASDNGDKTP